MDFNKSVIYFCPQICADILYKKKSEKNQN